jgi:hypothetical protein
LRIDEVTGTYDGQAEKHNPIPGERDDDTHDGPRANPQSMDAW